MHIALRPCPANNRKRKDNDEHEEDDLNQRGEVLKPSENRIGHSKSSTGYDHKDSDYSHSQQSRSLGVNLMDEELRLYQCSHASNINSRHLHTHGKQP